MPANRATRTYRMRKIPFDIQGHELAQWICDLNSSIGPLDNIMIRSLARDVGETEGAAPLKTATLQFKSTPQIFDNDETEWQLYSSYRERVLVDVAFAGFTVLHEPPSGLRKANCIFISGLSSHAYGSWKSRALMGAGDKDYMWPRDRLRFDFPELRTMLWGYDTALIESLSGQSVLTLAQSFKSDLLKLQQLGNETPLLVCAHSLGGIVVKQALVLLAESSLVADRVALQNVAGVMFFGVPHGGMPIEHIRAVVKGRNNEQFVESLNKGSQYLRLLDSRWCNSKSIRRIDAVSVIETKQSPTFQAQKDGGWKLDGSFSKYVDEQSARLHGSSWFTIDEDHSNLVKFSPDSVDYGRVLQRMRAIPLRVHYHTLNQLPQTMHLTGVIQVIGAHLQDLMPGLKRSMETFGLRGFNITGLQPPIESLLPLLQNCGYAQCRFSWLYHPDAKVTRELARTLCTPRTVSTVFKLSHVKQHAQIALANPSMADILRETILGLLRTYPRLRTLATSKLQKLPTNSSHHGPRWFPFRKRLPVTAPGSSNTESVDASSADATKTSIGVATAASQTQSHSPKLPSSTTRLTQLLSELLTGTQEPITMFISMLLDETLQSSTGGMLSKLIRIFEKAASVSGKIDFLLCAVSNKHIYSINSLSTAILADLHKWTVVETLPLVDAHVAKIISENLAIGCSQNPRSLMTNLSPEKAGKLAAARMRGHWTLAISALEQVLVKMVHEEAERVRERDKWTVLLPSDSSSAVAVSIGSRR